MFQQFIKSKKNKCSEIFNPAIAYQLVVNLIGLYLIIQAAVSANLGLDMIWVYIFWVAFSTITELKPITMPNNDQLTNFKQ